MIAMRCGRQVSSRRFFASSLTLAGAAILLLLTAATVLAGGGDLLWQAGAAVPGKQEARAAVVDSQGDLVLAGFGDSSVGEGRIVKLRGDGGGPVWTATFNLDSGIDMATAVVVDSHDDVLVTGFGHNGINYDVYTAKYAAVDGALLWSHAYRGPAGGDGFGNALAVDALNNVYVGGQVQGANGKEDALLIKYGPGGANPDGSPLWVRTWNGAADGHDQILALAAGVDGVAGTGKSQNAIPDYDAITLKYSFSGELLWEKIYADTCDGEGRAVRMDPAGNVVMAGCVSNGSNRDLYVGKYPANGGPALWEKIVDLGYDDEAKALWLDGAGDVYVTGTVFTPETAQDVFTLKLAGVSGAELWRAQYNSVNGNREFGLALVVDEEGDLFVAGYQNDAITQKDAFLTLKYAKASGNLLWAQTFPGVGQNNRAVGLGLAPDGTVLVAGWSDRWTDGSSDYDFYAVAYDAGAVNPPTSLRAQVVTNSEIGLDWTDNSDREDGFVVERRIGDTGNFTPIASLAADTISYLDTGLTPDTRYVYRVKAVSASEGDSPYSNLAAAKTTVIEEQAPSWQYRYDGPDRGDDYAAAIAIGPDNHPVVTGASFAVDGAFDYLTVKIDRATAAKLWEARYNDPDYESDYATSVAVDGANRVIVTGYASLYGGGAGNTNDIYTIGYPAGGPPSAWADQYNGPHGSDDRSAAVSVATDGSNNVVVIGYGKNAAWNDDIYVLKYGPSGARAWAAVPYDGGGHDYPAAVVFTPAGDIHVVGRTHNGSNYDMFIAKYAGSDGSRLWTRTYAGPGVGNDYAEALAVDAAGNLYVAGYAVNEGGQGVACLLKYDADGNQLWARLDQGEGSYFSTAQGLAIDPLDGSILVAGTVRVGAGAHDFLLRRFDAAGEVLWHKRMERPESDDAVVAMAMDRFGLATVAGRSGDDILVMKFDAEGTVVGANLFASGYGVDEPAGVAVNGLDEAFVAGTAVNAGNNADYLIFKASGTVLPPPFPVTAIAGITQVNLAWSNNAADQAGLLLQRHVGTCGDAQPNWTDMILGAATTAYADEGLPTGVVYCYRLRAFHANGDFSRPILQQVTTQEPQQPSDLSVTAVNTTQIHLAWTDPTPVGESGYDFVIQRCQGDACNFSEADPLFVVASPAASWTDDGVCAGGSYRYRLLARKDGVWASEFSAPVGAATPQPGGAPVVSASAVSEHEIRLDWVRHTIDETGFAIERCAGAGCMNFALLTIRGAATTSFTDSGLTPGSTYSYRLRAFKDAVCPWQTDYSGDVSAVPMLQPPGAVQAMAVNTTTVQLSWEDRTASETAFRVERCQGNAVACADGLYQQVTVAAADTVAIVDTDVCSGATYVYRVRAERVIDDQTEWLTDWTQSQPVTTPLYANPASLVASVVSETEIRLQWVDSNTDESGFVIERCLADCGAPDNFQFLWRSSDQQTSYDDRDLTANSSYHYRLQAYKEGAVGHCDWTSDYTEVVFGTTTPSAPGDFTAMPVNSTRVDLSWQDRTVSETGFLLERCNGANSDCQAEFVAEWSLLLPANAIGHTDNGVCAQTPYRYRVRAEKGAEWLTEWAYVQTSSLAPGTAPGLLPPVNLTESSVTIVWDDATIDESQFVLERCTGADCSDFAPLKTYPGTVDGNLLLYHMEESAWSVAGAVIDSSGRGHHGTAVNAQPVADGWYGRGGSFNGSNRYITTPLTVDQSSTSPGATFQAWVNPAVSDTGYRHVISTDNGGRDWGIVIYNGRWYLANGSSWVNTNALAPANEWQHVAAVFIPGTGVRFYRNGVLVFSNATISYDTSTAVVQVGRLPSTTSTAYYFNGRMDEVAVHARPLTAAEIFGHYEAGIQRYHYTDTPLLPDSTYRYRVTASKEVPGGCPWHLTSEPIDITTAPPPMPANLAATATNTTTIQLTWQDVSDSNTNFILERCDNGLASCTSDFVPAFSTTLGPNATGYSDTSVCNGSEHRYRVRMVRNVEPAWEGDWVYAQTTTPVPLTPVLTLTPVSEDQISLSWTYASTDRTGFTVERCAGDAAACATGPFTEIHITTATGSPITYLDTGLGIGVSYTYRVRAYKTASCPWEGPYDQKSATTLVPPAPTSLTATVVSTTSIDLTWVDNTTTETGFRLERCLLADGVACDQDEQFVFLASKGANVTIHSDTTVCSGSTYVYRVRAENATAPWQTDWVVSAPRQAPAHQAPTSVTATQISEKEIAVGWAYHTSSDVSGFLIERCGGDLSVCTEDGSFTEVGTVLAAAREYRNTNLDINVTYTYRVRAYKEADCPWTSLPSASASASTPILPPVLSVTPINTTRIDLTWVDRTATESLFRIERCMGEQAVCSAQGSFVHLANVNANVVTYPDNSACCGTTYTYRVRAENTTVPWQSDWSSELDASTPSPAASTLTVPTIGENEVSLQWNDVTTDEQNFRIERCTGAGCSDFAQIASLTANTTTYNDNTVQTSTVYRYRVQTYKGATCIWQVFSNVVEVHTLPASVTDLSAVALNSMMVRLQWTDRATDETGYEVEVQVWNNRYVVLGRLGANATEFIDSLAQPGTIHRYRVRSMREGVYSAYSNEAVTSTPAYHPDDTTCWP